MVRKNNNIVKRRIIILESFDNHFLHIVHINLFKIVLEKFGTCAHHNQTALFHDTNPVSNVFGTEDIMSAHQD